MSHPDNTPQTGPIGSGPDSHSYGGAPSSARPAGPPSHTSTGRIWIIGLAACLALALVAVVILATSRGSDRPASPQAIGPAVASGSSSSGSTSIGNAGSTMLAVDGTISNADSFVSDIESRWRSGIVDLTKDDATIGAGAGCYYVVDATTQQFLQQAVCGPIRRLGSAPDHVWDLFRVSGYPARYLASTATTGSPTADSEIFGNGDNTTSAGPAESVAPSGPAELVLVAEGLESVGTGVVLPSGNLYRPDGRQPAADAGELAEPAMPTAKPDLFTEVSLDGLSTSAAVTIDPAKNTVVTPGGTLSIDAVATVDALSATGDQATTTTAGGGYGTSTAQPTAGRQLAPAKGYSFRVVTVSFTKGWPKGDEAFAPGENSYDPPLSAPDVKVTLINGGTRTDVTNAIVGQDPSSKTFAISIKDGTDPQFAVSAAGREQAISMVKATRLVDPESAVYYRANRQVAVNNGIPAMTKAKEYDGGFGPETATVTYNLSVGDVRLTAYNAVVGWAPKGQVWVQVKTADKADLNRLDAKIDRSKWVVAVSGKNYRMQDGGGGPGISIFSIPANTSKVDGDFATVVSIYNDQTKIADFPVTLKWTAAFGE